MNCPSCGVKLSKGYYRTKFTDPIKPAWFCRTLDCDFFGMAREREEDMSPDTVEQALANCEKDIERLKVHGLSGVIVIKILECLVEVIRTLALHTVAARIKKS